MTIQPEETVQSETVFHGKAIDVHKDTVRLSNGKTVERDVVVHPETVAILPFLPDGRLVLVRQFRYAAGRTLLEVPAGGIDEGEGPEDAVRREMKEETGYRVGRAERLVAFFTSPGFTNEYMHLFAAHDLQPGTPTEENDEIEVALLTPAEAWTCVERGEIADAKSILAIRYALDNLA